MSRNTIWTPELAPATTLRGSGWGRVDVNDNVIHRAWTDTSAPFGNLRGGERPRLHARGAVACHGVRDELLAAVP